MATSHVKWAGSVEYDDDSTDESYSGESNLFDDHSHLSVAKVSRALTYVQAASSHVNVARVVAAMSYAQ